MSVDEVAVLRAAGLESAAKVIEAARAGQVAAQPPAAPEAPAPTPAPVEAETPGQRYERERNAQQEPAQEFTLADYDRMSPDRQREFALSDEGDAAITAALRREG
jgi:hypothetical protein